MKSEKRKGHCVIAYVLFSESERTRERTRTTIFQTASFALFTTTDRKFCVKRVLHLIMQEVRINAEKSTIIEVCFSDFMKTSGVSYSFWKYPVYNAHPAD